MLITHGINAGCHCSVKVDQHVFLPPIMFLELSRTSSFVLALQMKDVAHKASEFLVSRIACIVGQVRHCSLPFRGSDARDCEALTGCLRGTYSAVKHFFFLYADHVLRPLIAVAFIGTGLFTGS
jgi:hypothetical protein